MADLLSLGDSFLFFLHPLSQGEASLLGELA